MKIVFCMGTGHNTVNTMPLESDNIRPDLVCVGISQGKREQGLDLINQLKSTGFKTETLNIENENSLSALTHTFETWLESHFDDEILVNLTGGNKLMTLAAYQVFNGYGFRCFYQIHPSNELIWLDNESKESNIGHKISLERYLAQYQFKIQSRQPIQQVAEAAQKYSHLIFEDLKRNYDKSCLFISKLNGLAAEKIDAQKRLEFRKSLTQEEVGFIEHLAHETGLFRLDHSGLVFSDAENRSIVAGGWLEILVGESLKEVSKTRDLCLNAVFEKSTARLGSASKNEMDVMTMIGPVLYLAECKTVRWEGKTNASADQSIYKLSALSDIGGLNTRAAFVSLYDIKSADKTRAAENNILLIAGKELLGLKSHLQRWTNH